MATEPKTLFVSGLHLVLNGITGDAGDRNGVASIVVPVHVPDIATALSLDAQEVARSLGIGGLKCTGRPLQELEFGEYVVSFHFEGLNGEVTFDQAENQASYSFSGEMGDAPIQSHPAFEQLAQKYNWNAEEEKFPRELANTKAGSSTALSKTTAAKKAANPLHGTEAFLKVGATYSRTIAVTTVSPAIYEGIGTLVAYPPGAEILGIPRFKRRVWLKLAPEVNNEAGSAVRVTERYRLTGMDPAAARDIYGAGQLEE